MKTVPPGYFDPIARNAEKEAARAADARLLESGAITPEELARRNAFIPYSMDLSRWTVVYDSIAEDDEGLP